jgi:hypothetical protein
LPVPQVTIANYRVILHFSPSPLSLSKITSPGTVFYHYMLKN